MIIKMSSFMSFVYFSCQFVVKDGQDYSVHLMDPDVLVKWESVEQVVSPFLQKGYSFRSRCSKISNANCLLEKGLDKQHRSRLDSIVPHFVISD